MNITNLNETKSDSRRTAVSALFLMDALRGSLPDSHFLNVSRFINGSPVSICAGTPQLPAAARWIGESESDTYICLSLLDERLHRKQRISEDRVTGLLGFAMDFDAVTPYRKRFDIFEHVDQAIEAVKELPVQPRLIIKTGGGIQPVWLFKEPWMLKTDADRAAAKGRSRKLQDAVRRIVHARFNVVLDSTADLARLVRAPGSLNCKTNPPVEVEVVFGTGDYL